MVQPQPPPGTVYNLHPRLNHPSLIDRSDVVERFKQLEKLAPYDYRIINFLLNHQFNEKPNYEQATNLFQAVLPYSTYAMRSVANTVYNQPEKYQKLMLQAAALDPVFYYNLADYEIDRKEDDSGAKYMDLACDKDPERSSGGKPGNLARPVFFKNRSDRQGTEDRR